MSINPIKNANDNDSALLDTVVEFIPGQEPQSGTNKDEDGDNK